VKENSRKKRGREGSGGEGVEGQNCNFSTVSLQGRQHIQINIGDKEHSVGSLLHVKFGSSWSRGQWVWEPQISTFGQNRGILVVFRLAGATLCTDQDEIWHGKAHHRFINSCQI